MSISGFIRHSRYLFESRQITFLLHHHHPNVRYFKINQEMDVCFPNGVILVLKIIPPLIKFLIFNLSFHSIFILKIILVSIFILFTRFNLSFYSILFL